MKKTVVSGVVKRVEIVDRNLSFVTLIPMADEGYVETTIPVYMELDNSYQERDVDIINIRSGFLGRHFKQKIETADSSHSIEMPYSLVKSINRRPAKEKQDLTNLTYRTIKS